MLSREERIQIANTIIEQMGGAARLKLMIGAKTFTALDCGLGFFFGACRKANHVDIVLDPSDTYTMKFCLAGRKIRAVKEFEGLYFDQLQEVFSEYTGLILEVPRFGRA